MDQNMYVDQMLGVYFNNWETCRSIVPEPAGTDDLHAFASSWPAATHFYLSQQNIQKQPTSCTKKMKHPWTHQTEHQIYDSSHTGSKGTFESVIPAQWNVLLLPLHNRAVNCCFFKRQLKTLFLLMNFFFFYISQTPWTMIPFVWRLQ